MVEQSAVTLSEAKGLATPNAMLRSAQHDKVSVIIPTYNRAHLIGETLDSVFKQTRRADQVIVVDDGSQDDTENILDPFADRVTYRRISHAGASVARNVGLDIARGEYVAFLDSDDVWERQFLERMTATLDSARDAGFVYCDYAMFNAHGLTQTAYLPSRHKLNGNLFASLLETDFISTGALLIRRACFARVGGFDPALEIAHDWDMWLRLAREFDAIYLDEPLVRIRTDSNGLSRNTPVLHANNLRILAKLRNLSFRGAERREISNPFVFSRSARNDRLSRYQIELIRRNTFASHRALWAHNWQQHRPLPMLKHFVLMFAARFL